MKDEELYLIKVRRFEDQEIDEVTLVEGLGWSYDGFI